MAPCGRGLAAAICLALLFADDRGHVCAARKTSALDEHDLSILESAWRTRQQGQEGGSTPSWSSSTMAGSASGIPGNTTGVGTYALFNEPSALALSTDRSHILLVDAGNLAIRRITVSSRNVATLATFGAGACPSGITSTSSRIYVSDMCLHTVSSFPAAGSPAGQSYPILTGSSGTAGFLDGASSPLLSSPRGIISDTLDASLYVADYGNRRVRKVIIASGETTTLAGSGELGSEDGQASAASFSYPVALALSGSGRSLYVADNDLVRSVVLTTVGGMLGRVSTIASSSSLSPSLTSIAVPFSGGTLAAAGSNNVVLRSSLVVTVDDLGVEVTTASSMAVIAGSADSSGYSNGGPSETRFGQPIMITYSTDYDTSLAVSDSSNNALRSAFIGDTNSPGGGSGYASCSGPQAGQTCGCQTFGNCSCGTYQDFQQGCIPCPEGFFCDCESACQGRKKPCPPGTYNGLASQGSVEACVPCSPQGYICPIGSVAPKMCPVGYRCPGTGDGGTDQFPCLEGTYSPGGQVECLPCPAGSHEPGTMSTGCKACPEGHFCPFGSQTPEACQPGSGCPSNSSLPAPCPAGTFSAAPLSVSCTPCALGLTTEGGGHSSSAACNITAPIVVTTTTTTTTTTTPAPVTTTPPPDNTSQPTTTPIPSPSPSPPPPFTAPTPASTWTPVRVMVTLSGFTGIADFECCHDALLTCLEPIARFQASSGKVVRVCSGATFCRDYATGEEEEEEEEEEKRRREGGIGQGGSPPAMIWDARRQAGSLDVTVSALTGDPAAVEAAVGAPMSAQALTVAFSTLSGRAQLTAELMAVPRETPPPPPRAPPRVTDDAQQNLNIAVAATLTVVAVGIGAIYAYARWKGARRRKERAARGAREEAYLEVGEEGEVGEGGRDGAWVGGRLPTLEEENTTEGKTIADPNGKDSHGGAKGVADFTDVWGAGKKRQKKAGGSDDDDALDRLKQQQKYEHPAAASPGAGVLSTGKAYFGAHDPPSKIEPEHSTTRKANKAQQGAQFDLEEVHLDLADAEEAAFGDSAAAVSPGTSQENGWSSLDPDMHKSEPVRAPPHIPGGPHAQGINGDKKQGKSGKDRARIGNGETHNGSSILHSADGANDKDGGGAAQARSGQRQRLGSESTMSSAVSIDTLSSAVSRDTLTSSVTGGTGVLSAMLMAASSTGGAGGVEGEALSGGLSKMMQTAAKRSLSESKRVGGRSGGKKASGAAAREIPGESANGSGGGEGGASAAAAAAAAATTTTTIAATVTGAEGTPVEAASSRGLSLPPHPDDELRSLYDLAVMVPGKHKGMGADALLDVLVANDAAATRADAELAFELVGRSSSDGQGLTYTDFCMAWRLLGPEGGARYR